MKLHGNARTRLHGRRLMVERVMLEGWTLAESAEAAGVSVRYGLEISIEPTRVSQSRSR